MRNVKENDLAELKLPFCDLLLTGLSVGQKPLVPPFDPYHDRYVAASGPSKVTVTAAVSGDHIIRVLDVTGNEIADADDTLAGHQVELGMGLGTIKIEVTSPNWVTANTYTVNLLRTDVATACVTGGAVSDAYDDIDLVFDCETLLLSRDALAGTAILNWSENIDIDNWNGVTLGGTPRRVTGLNLRRKQLTGFIPPELGRLSMLERLYLDANQLNGPIPIELGNLSNLRVLILQFNQLAGAIPSELGGLSNLGILSLGNNRLTGPVPIELGNLSNLKDLWLAENRLTGPIPADFGYLSNLESLYLDSNKLTGSIPVELSALSGLHFLDLSNNRLAGRIPTELGRLSNLEILRLNNNRLTGPIPAELGTFPNLKQLYLYSNRFDWPDSY